MQKLFFSLLLFWTTMNSSNQIKIQYILSMPKPQTHIFEVEMKISDFSTKEKFIDFQLPVWRSGRYMIFDFASGVLEFIAIDDAGKKLNFKKTSKSIWRVETNNSKEISIKYKIYANEFKFRTRGLNSEHGFVDGSSVFMFVEKFRNLPIELKALPFDDWKVTTGLQYESKNIFSAPNYDYLVDCPLEIGNQTEIDFDVDGIPHTIMIFGNNKVPRDTMISDFTKIIKSQKKFWGMYPYKKYIFMIHSTSLGGGGTEHINSTIMGTTPQNLNSIEEYRTKFLGLVSHEFFHTWNVKYLRPKGIVPYNFMEENYLEELWIAEGTTSYFDDLILVREKFKSTENYLKEFAQRVQNDRARPGNLVQSVSESSFDSWVKFWRNTPQSFNFESDYYEKGANVSFILDMELRASTNNKISLDDVFREMLKRFPFASAGYDLTDFKKVCEELSNKNLNEFFNKYVYGVAPIPWEKYFNVVGFELMKKDSIQQPLIGISVQESNEKTIVTNISSGSPFFNSGLDVGDEIISINDKRVKGNFANSTSQLKINEKISILFSHGDDVKIISLNLNIAKQDAYILKQISNPSAIQKQTYLSWLN